MVNLHVAARHVANPIVQMNVLRLLGSFPQPVLLTGDFNGMISRKETMQQVEAMFRSTQGSIGGLPSPSVPASSELGEPCVMGSTVNGAM